MEYRIHNDELQLVNFGTIIHHTTKLLKEDTNKGKISVEKEVGIGRILLLLITKMEETME